MLWFCFRGLFALFSCFVSVFVLFVVSVVSLLVFLFLFSLLLSFSLASSAKRKRTAFPHDSLGTECRIGKCLWFEYFVLFLASWFRACDRNPDMIELLDFLTSNENLVLVSGSSRSSPECHLSVLGVPPSLIQLLMGPDCQRSL